MIISHIISEFSIIFECAFVGVILQLWNENGILSFPFPTGDQNLFLSFVKSPGFCTRINPKNTTLSEFIIRFKNAELSKSLKILLKMLKFFQNYLCFS